MSERRSLRILLHHLQPNEVILTERYHCSVFTSALLQHMEHEFVAHSNALPTAVLRREGRLSDRDQIATGEGLTALDWLTG